MPRLSVTLMIAGGVGVLVVLVVLFRSITSDTEAIEVEARAPAASAPSPAAPTDTPSASPRGRSAVIPQVVTRAPDPARTADSAPSLESAPESAPEPGTRANTKNLHYGMAQLREQTAAVEPLVRDCVARAAASGHKPTGSAKVSFVVVQKGDQVIVEQTDVDSDETTLENPELLECLRETARSMKFAGLPREAKGLIVNRNVMVQDGELSSHNLIGFSYLRY